MLPNSNFWAQHQAQSRQWLWGSAWPSTPALPLGWPVQCSPCFLLMQLYPKNINRMDVCVFRSPFLLHLPSHTWRLTIPIRTISGLTFESIEPVTWFICRYYNFNINRDVLSSSVLCLKCFLVSCSFPLPNYRVNPYMVCDEECNNWLPTSSKTRMIISHLPITVS